MLNKSFLTVGGKRFHYIWLRDNCFCPECRRPNTLRKVYDISDCTSHPEPLLVEEQDSELTILWNELELDEQDSVKRVNFGHAHTCAWDLPFDEMELFYEAYFTFLD